MEMENDQYLRNADARQASTAASPKRIMICWAAIAGYLAVCWRSLAAEPGIDLKVVAYRPAGSHNAPFDAQLMQGIPHSLYPDPTADLAKLSAEVVQFKPDVLAIAGWAYPGFNQLLSDSRLTNTRVIMGVDTPWQGTLRQRLASFKLGGLLKNVDAFVVPGERAFQRVRALGVPEKKIHRGMYGIDFEGLSPALDKRMASPWPRRFVFAGRYVQEKGVDVLVDAYKRYRATVTEPWELHCCGTGPLAPLMQGVEGLTDRGFIQPSEMPGILRDAGVFVLASRFDPWPLVVVESCAAGLPVLCTAACGSAVELVRSQINGVTVATEDAADLARAMRYLHDRVSDLPVMGQHSRELARGYSAANWVRKWRYVIESITAQEGTAR